jgi:GT2 family glycosyltransferase
MSGATVVIPTWNRKDLIERVVPLMVGQTKPPEEILVVDNGSADGTTEAAERLGARVLRFERNRGFAAAVNAGIRTAETDWVAVVNNDVEPARDWLEQLFAAARPEIWFALGKIVGAGRPELLDGTFDVICRGGCSWRAGHGRPDSSFWSVPGPALFPPFTAALFRRELFERVGFLDERLESFLEDVDFGLRCALGGYSGIYVPRAVAAHQSGATLGPWSPRMVSLVSRNQLLLVAKHFPPGWLWRYGWPVFVAQSLWGAVALRHGCGRAWLEGKWRALRMFRGMRPAQSVDAGRLRTVLQDSELQLERLQRHTGFDWFWRLYFSLT